MFGLSAYALLRRKSRKKKRGVVKLGDPGGRDDIVDVACVRSPSSTDYFDRRFNDSLELYNAPWLFRPAFVKQSPKRNKERCIVPKWTVRYNATVSDPCRWNPPAVSGNSVIFALPKSYSNIQVKRWIASKNRKIVYERSQRVTTNNCD